MKLNKLKKAILFVDLFVAILVVTVMLTTKNFTQIFWATAPEKSLAGAETMGFNFVASPEETKTKAGETVTLTLSVADISAGENGINSIVGFLDYNESLFETVEFQGINSGNQSNGNANNSISNDWNIEVNRIQGHELYGKFCIYTLQEGVKENQDVVKITLKLKSDLAPQTTEVNFTKLVSSDGVYEIAEEDRTAVIIIEDAEDEGNQGTEGDGDQGTEGDGDQGTEGGGDQDSEGNGNQGSNGNQNSNGSGNSNNQSNSPQTGDTKILIVVAILILVIIANLLIFCKKSKTKIIATVVTIIVGILSFVIVSNAQNTQNNTQPLTINDKINKISFQENLLNTDKVLVKDTTISAVTPEMTVEDFLNIFNSQIKVTDNGTQVTSGELKTGMNISLLNPTSTDIDKDTIYEVVVAGDINKDGISNQIELTKIIRNIINNQKWQLNDIEKLAADMNIDRKINNEDIEASVNYIVYGNYFKYTETVQEDIRNVDAPTIEAVQGNFNEEVNCYIDDVIIRITETDKNASKTRYKIEDENGNSVTISELANNSTGDNSSTQYTGLAKFVEIERTNKDENGNVIREILIKKDGIYKISALTDGELGNRSDVSYKVIVKGKSDKKYTVTYDYATNGGVSSIDSQIITEDVDVTYNTPVDLSKQGTKQYYKFIGWNTDATATTAFSTFTMGIQNETLYAIYERDIEIELDPTTISMEYGNTQTITATTKNTGNIIWSSSDESVATVSETGVVTAKKVGTVTITATASTDNTVTATCQVTVTPKTLTISAQADNKEYDGTTNVVNGQILVNGILNADDVLITADFAYEDANIGTDKKVNVTNVTLSGADANNYKINETTLTTTSSILAKSANNQDIQASLDNVQVTYNGKEQKPIVTITDNLITLIEGIDYEVEYKDNKNAGTATVKVTLKGNYSGTKGLTFEIQKAILTATYVGEAIEYGQTPQLKVTVDGFVNNETVDTAEGYAAPTVTATSLQQGTYTLTPQGGSAKNYDFNYVSGLLIINAKLDVDIQLAETQFIYDGTAKEPQVIIKDGNTILVEGTDYDVVYSDNINAGTGTATVTLKGNYAGTAVKTFTIAQAQGTGSVSIEGWIYGENAKTPVANSNTNTQVTYQYTGTTNGGVSYSSSVAPTQAGNYTVTATFDANNNYKGFTATADFVVDRKELTATYVSEEINYGDNPELKVEVTGFVNGETVETATGFTMPVVVNTNTEPGEYELTPEGGTATNYTFKYVKGILKINLPTFTITYELNDGELEQGNENPNEYTQKSEDITLNNPTKSGYEFLGWTLTKLDGVAQGSSTPSTTETIAKGSKGNREYTANWILVAPTVEITAENLEVNLFENQTTTFTATVENASNPTYQWYYGENAIEGATASTYSISTTDMNSNNYKGGEYSVAVTNNETISTLAGTETNPTTTVSKELIQEVNYSEVSSAEQMKNFATRVNNQGIMFEGDTIKQSAETIDLSSVCSQSLGSWTPIGSDANMFKGIFDGDGNEVTNLYINEEEGMLGLFGVTKDSTIKNVTVSGFIKGTGVTWKTVAGGIVARNISGTVENCTNNVNIEAISRAGGIAGKSEEDSVITNCTNNGTITSDTTKTIEETVDGVTQTVVASRWIGGIAGVGQGVISNCTNTAVIVGNKAGGISGISNNGTTSILNCSNNGKITGNQIGGITYTFKGSTEDYKISNCANIGNLIVKDTYNETNLYGAGIANANDGLIERCYNTGDIEVISANYNGASIVGGIFAADGKGSIVRKCYNEGDITAECNHDGDSIHAMCSVGGIAGYIRRNTFIEDCYNRGDITANKLQGSNTNSAGGIVGYISFVELNEVTPGELLPEGQVNTDVNEMNSHMIKDCYSTGNIKGTNNGGNSYVGGVLGQYHATSRDINEIVSNTYYLNTSTDTGIDLNGVNTTSIAISKESSEMKEDVFVTLLGDDTWELVAGVNGDYPVFGWQYSTFNISYDLARGELLEGVTNPKSYAESSADIKLNNPVRTGYTFTGWTGTGLTEATIDVTIPSGSRGDREYTATWELAAPTVSVTVENPEVNLFDDVTTTFTANVENAANPTYQWYYNGTAIDGATASTYSISTTEMTEGNYKGGEYSVEVTNNEESGISLLSEIQNNTIAVSEPQTQTVAITVGTANQLKNLAIRVNEQDITFTGNIIKQTANIDLSSVCGDTKGNFTPIGYYNKNDGKLSKAIHGTYDGQNYEITNLYIGETITDSRVGLFALLWDGTLKNLTVRGTIKTSDSTDTTAGIIGQVTNATVENCKNYVNVTGVNNVGGLIGYGHATYITTVNNCENYGTIIATGTITETTGIYSGGIAAVGNGNIDNCHNYGNISGINVGGIVSYNNEKSNISNCTNNGTISGSNIGGIAFKSLANITNCINNGEIIGKNSEIDGAIYAAGIAHMNLGIIEKSYNTAKITAIGTETNGSVIAAGILSRDSYTTVGTVKKSFNIGEVIATANHSGESTAMCVAGGIVGYANNELIIENCYNTANVTATKAQGGNTNSAGGIIAYSIESNLQISNCYNSGLITTKRIDGNASFNGGILGQNKVIDGKTVTITNCYYEEGKAHGGIQGADVAGSAEVRTQTFMKTDEFVTLLGADDWQIVADKNDGYPVLNWQYATYAISYDLAGGELPQGATNPSYYAKDSADITLNNPKREMYVFTGWTGSNGTTPELTVTIPKGSTGNKTYTANWTEAYYYNETSDTYYAKLADATSSSATGSQINVVKNANETARATVSSNKELTLNLNNYTVSYTGTADTFRLYNEGTLNIIGSGKITSTEGYTLRNSGTMNIRLEDDGLVESIGNEITDRAIQNSGTGVLNIYSGTIRTDVTNTVVENAQTYAIVGNTGTTINLYGGKIDATATHPYQSGVISEGTVNVRGGIIEANLRGITIKNVGNLNITKGSINSLVDGNAIFFASTGTLSITGTEIVDIISNNANGIRNSTEDGGNGTIIINNSNATISGNSGIYMEIGNVDVIAGTVIGKTNYGIGSDSIGSITIGKDDSTVSQVTPVITGVSYGVNRSAGTLNFYDGLMKGATAAFSGEVADKPDDYTVSNKTEDGKDVAYLKYNPAIKFTNGYVHIGGEGGNGSGGNMYSSATLPAGATVYYTLEVEAKGGDGQGHGYAVIEFDSAVVDSLDLSTYITTSTQTDSKTNSFTTDKSGTLRIGGYGSGGNNAGGSGYATVTKIVAADGTEIPIK